MKVALVHDYIKEYGGAERVLEALHEMYPDAPVFTSVYLPQFLGPHQERFRNWDIRTSFLQKLPLKAKLISPFRLIASFAFKQFDLSEFDVIIVSATGAYFPNAIRKGTKNQKLRTKNKKGRAVQICYCHTPPRYLYGYATAREWKKNIIFRVLGELANHFLRMSDFAASKNVDFYIANSEEVARRIKKFYRREATIVYPPVNVNSKFEIRNSKLKDNESYFLAGGRLARPKHIELIIEACAQAQVPLKLFGRGFAGYEEDLKSQILNLKSTNKNVKIEFVGEVTDEEKYALMQNAKAFIFAGEDEDFGILPVEAMSTGLPVIAYRSGGVQETVIDGKTGVFFNELIVKSLSDAIKKFGKMNIDGQACRKQAEKFSKERFQKEIKEFLARI